MCSDNGRPNGKRYPKDVNKVAKCICRRQEFECMIECRLSGPANRASASAMISLRILNVSFNFDANESWRRVCGNREEDVYQSIRGNNDERIPVIIFGHKNGSLVHNNAKFCEETMYIDNVPN